MTPPDRVTTGPMVQGRAAAIIFAAVVILAASLFVGVGPPSAGEKARHVAAAQSAAPGPARRASAAEVRAYFNDMFDRLDRDSSGRVELAEAPQHQLIAARQGDGTFRQLPLTQAEWFAKGDGDRNGGVDRTEYFNRLLPPVQAVFGVPEEWQPRSTRAGPPN